MYPIIFIASGGALGAVARYALSSFIHTVFGRGFPYGTLSINLLGCFLAGVCYVLLLERVTLAVEWRSFLLIGFLGSFTTFSTFSLETVDLLVQGRWWAAGFNIALNVLFCLLALVLGIKLTRVIYP